MKHLGIIFALLLCSFSALGQRITASITVTNLTTNGQTLTVNGFVRTWTNNVVTAVSQIATNNDVTGNGSKTNLLNQIRQNPYSQILPFDTGSNSLQLVGNCGAALVVTASAGWATVSYSTQSCTTSFPVESPFTAYPSVTMRTNTASQLVQDLSDYGTNSLSQSSPVTSQLLGTNKTQTVFGATTLLNPVIIGGSIFGLPTIYLSNNAASETSSFFTHYDALGGDSFMVGHGGNEFFLGLVDTNGTGIAGGQSKSYIDFNLNGESEYNIIGAGGLAHRFYITPNSGTSTNYFEITTTGVRAPIVTAPFIGNGGGLSNLNAAVLTNTIPPGPLSGVSISNLNFQGTASFPANADLAFAQKTITTLANGGNQDLQIGTNVVISIPSGPTGAFTIYGIANGRDGKVIIIKNKTGQSMTIANQSGLETTPANRIRTGSGADRSNANNPGCVILEYDAADSRWDLVGSND